MPCVHPSADLQGTTQAEGFLLARDESHLEGDSVIAVVPLLFGEGLLCTRPTVLSNGVSGSPPSELGCLWPCFLTEARA